MQTKWMAGLVVAALFTACGYDGLRGAYEESGTVGTQAAGLNVDVRLKATNGSAFQSLLLRAGTLEVRAGDRVLKSEVRGELADLTQKDHAWRIGGFELPADVTEVEVRVTMDELGAWETVSGAGHVDTQGAVLTATIPAELFASGKVVLDVDAERSFVALNDGAVAFVPVWRTLH